MIFDRSRVDPGFARTYYAESIAKRCPRQSQFSIKLAVVTVQQAENANRPVRPNRSKDKSVRTFLTSFVLL